MQSETINSRILEPLFAAGGEMEISLWEEADLNLVYEAKKNDLVKIGTAGWGDRTIMKLTKTNRAALHQR